MRSKLFIILGGLLAVFSLYYFGRTTEKKSLSPQQETPSVSTFNFSSFLGAEKQKLPLTIRQLTESLELQAQNASDTEKINYFTNLAGIWRDSAGQPELYGYYTGEAAKLANSEKKLTFAAQLTVDILRRQKDESRVDWLSSRSIDLFERAIRLNPDNDDLKVGLGSAYIFGRGRTGHPEETMKGVQQLLAVARKDSNNMKAQLMLGIDRKSTRLNSSHRT